GHRRSLPELRRREQPRRQFGQDGRPRPLVTARFRDLVPARPIRGPAVRSGRVRGGADLSGLAAEAVLLADVSQRRASRIRPKTSVASNRSAPRAVSVHIRTGPSWGEVGSRPWEPRTRSPSRGTTSIV